MTDPLEIRLLGPFEVFVGGRPAEVTGPKRHALLALLALRGGRVVPVEVLVDALWGAEVPTTPRNAVQHHVSRLRAALGAESKHPKASWGWLRRRYLPRWWPTHGATELLRCGQVTVRRYRYRGAQIPTSWTAIG